ncbi:hypothetical protein PANDA_010483, partial [Ailuropoda melanoleuca]
NATAAGRTACAPSARSSPSASASWRRKWRCAGNRLRRRTRRASYSCSTALPRAWRSPQPTALFRRDLPTRSSARKSEPWGVGEVRRNFRGSEKAKLQKFDLFPKALLQTGRPGSPQPPPGKPLSPDGADSGPGTSSPEVRPGSGSENGDGESFSGSPLARASKEAGGSCPGSAGPGGGGEEDSPGSASPLGSESGSEADKEEAEAAPAPGLGGVPGPRQRTPLDILTRVFPGHRRGVLELVLQGCGGDVPMRQVLNHHRGGLAAGLGPAVPPDKAAVAGGPGLPAPLQAGPAAPPHHRPLLAGAMAPGALGSLSSRSAFSPLQPNASHFGADAGAYPLGAPLGLSPLRLAYSAAAAHSRGLAFMAPYSTAGLVPTLGFRPPMDYAFSDLMRDRSAAAAAVHKEPTYGGG